MGKINSKAEYNPGPNEVRIVLVGRTGVGKSMTGNNILLRKSGDQSAFKSGIASVTQKSSFAAADVCDKRVVVVDTPGLFDAGRPNKAILKEIAKVVLLSAPGAHAIILVMQADRLTPEYQDTLDLLVKLFQKKVYKYMIVLFTKKDELEREDISEKDFLKTIPDNFKKLVFEQCSGHWIFFNNKNPTKSAREAQTERLLAMIEDLSVEQVESECYTSDDLQSRVNQLMKENDMKNLDEFRNKVMTDESYVEKVYKWIKDIFHRK